MKKLFLIVTLLFWAGTLFGQQQPDLRTQLQQAQNKIMTLQIVLAETKAERNAAIVKVAQLLEQVDLQRNGIIESEKILKKAITDDKKPDYKALNLLGWDLVLPDSTDKGKQPDSLSSKCLLVRIFQRPTARNAGRFSRCRLDNKVSR